MDVGNVSESCAVMVLVTIHGMLREKKLVSFGDCIVVRVEIQALIWNLQVGGVDFDFDFGALERKAGKNLKVRRMDQKNCLAITWKNVKVE